MRKKKETNIREKGVFIRIKNRSHNPITLTQANNEPFATIDPGKYLVVVDTKIKGDKSLQEQVNLKEKQGLLENLNLGLEVGVSYIIHNMTARQIGIERYSVEEGLILPPFGSRELKGEFMKSYNYLPWERQSLITIEDASNQKKNKTVIAGISILVALFVIFLIVSIPLEIYLHRNFWPVIGWVSAIFLIVLAGTTFIANKLTNVGDMGETLSNWLQLTPGIALVLLTGIGLPFVAVYLFGSGKALFQVEGRTLATLGRAMQISFISVAAMLPALLYYLFGRLQIEKRRNSFFREAMQLDPNIQSFSEASNKYDPLLDSVFGNGNSPFSILLLVITTAFLVLGWVIVLDPVSTPPDPIHLIFFFTPHPNTFTLGFLGTYYFAINLVFRRFVRSDLTPKTYAYIVVRILITLALVWAVSTLPQFAPNGANAASINDPLVNSGLMAVAFIIGIFPDTGLALITDFVKGITKNAFKGDKPESFPLSDLEGINLYDRARLLEEGIENIENLAHHDIMELIARTRIPTHRVIDMYDQSLLYIHMGMDASHTAPQVGDGNQVTGDHLLALLKSFGIRTASNLFYAFSHTTADLGNIEKALASQPEVISRLRVITDSIKEEDVLDNICHWYDLNLSSVTVTEPGQFYKIELLNKPVKTPSGAEPNTFPSNKSLAVDPALIAKNLSPTQQESTETTVVSVNG